jgi:hypothetical protein
MMRLPDFVLAVAVSLLVSCHALAGTVEPGGTVHFDGSIPFVPPTGDVIATDSRTLSLNYLAPPGFTFAEPAEAQKSINFSSQVLRDPATSRLTFLYTFEQPDLGVIGNEHSLADYQSFTGFITDVSGQGESGNDFAVSRSPDGALLTALGGGQGVGRPPTLAVATDALAWGRLGKGILQVTNEFGFISLSDPEEFQVITAQATAPISNTLQPTTITPPPTPIPLPAAFIPGAFTLLTAAAGRLRHR